MPHPFTVDRSIQVEATPEQVWEALTTGEQLDGWFIGAPNKVEPGLGGTVRLAFGGESGTSTITAWEPPHRFAHAGTPGPDGVVHAMEYTIDGRSGTTTVRLVHSGFLGDDWEAEYEALGEGDLMYLHQLGQYVQHFRGRRATVVAHFQPGVAERPVAMSLLHAAMGLTDRPSLGDAVRLEPAGLPAVAGTVDFLSPSIIGVRAADALYRFLFSPMGGGIYMGHHVYRDDVDVPATTSAWATWLDAAVATSQTAPS